MSELYPTTNGDDSTISANDMVQTDFIVPPKPRTRLKEYSTANNNPKFMAQVINLYGEDANSEEAQNIVTVKIYSVNAFGADSNEVYAYAGAFESEIVVGDFVYVQGRADQTFEIVDLVRTVLVYIVGTDYAGGLTLGKGRYQGRTVKPFANDSTDLTTDFSVSDFETSGQNFVVYDVHSTVNKVYDLTGIYVLGHRMGRIQLPNSSYAGIIAYVTGTAFVDPILDIQFNTDTGEIQVKTLSLNTGILSGWIPKIGTEDCPLP